jgi:hypothetical protein
MSQGPGQVGGAPRPLIARRGNNGVYRFDLRLQGEDETVFFEVGGLFNLSAQRAR